MEIHEALSKAADKIQKNRPDLSREIGSMFARHERHLEKLKKIPGSHEMVMKSQEKFKEKLKQFLSGHQALDLYADMVGFVMGNIAEVVRSTSEGKGNL